MTYRELHQRINDLDDDQLAMNVTVYDSYRDEFWSVDRFVPLNTDNDVLDAEHPYVVI